MSVLTAPAAPPDVGAPLLRYLKDRLRRNDLRFADGPARIPDGWEAHVYRFQLRGRDPLPRPFHRLLILRAYCNEKGVPRLCHEFAVQRHLSRRAYPVPRPLLLEKDPGLLGGPFMVMEWVPGQTMLDLLLRQFTSIVWAPARMAEAHARLHALPAGDFPHPPGPLLDRSLEGMRAILDAFDLDGLAPGLAWLEAHHPGPPESVHVVHLDFHPVNLMFDAGRCRAVLDWGDADVGDRHADLGATLVLIDTTVIPGMTLAQRLASLVGRGMLRRGYLRAYRRHLPIDRDRLRYYRAWAALRRLCRWATWLCASPLINGSKPSSINHLRPDRIAVLERYFHQHTGVAVALRPS